MIVDTATPSSLRPAPRQRLVIPPNHSDLSDDQLPRRDDAHSRHNRPLNHASRYVPGNHEFYKSEMKANLADGGKAADEAGIHLLRRRAVVIDGVRFLGCTLWTDYKLLGTPKPLMIVAGQELNDHSLIRYREAGGRISRFMPWHASAEHRLDLAFLRAELATPHDGPTVVVTHHAPHPRARFSRYTRAVICLRPSHPACDARLSLA